MACLSYDVSLQQPYLRGNLRGFFPENVTALCRPTAYYLCTMCVEYCNSSGIYTLGKSLLLANIILLLLILTSVTFITPCICAERLRVSWKHMCTPTYPSHMDTHKYTRTSTLSLSPSLSVSLSLYLYLSLFLLFLLSLSPSPSPSLSLSLSIYLSLSSPLSLSISLSLFSLFPSLPLPLSASLPISFCPSLHISLYLSICIILIIMLHTVKWYL